MAKAKGSLAELATPEPEIDDSAFYYCDLTLGSHRRWKGFGGGYWTRTEGQDGMPDSFEHHPATHRVGPVPGSVLKGLLVAAEDWRKANQSVQGGNYDTRTGIGPAQSAARTLPATFSLSLDSPHFRDERQRFAEKAQLMRQRAQQERNTWLASRPQRMIAVDNIEPTDEIPAGHYSPVETMILAARKDNQELVGAIKQLVQAMNK